MDDVKSLPSKDIILQRESRDDGRPSPEFGKPMLQNFLFDLSYRNLNHGSYGTYPREIQKKLRHYQDLAESKPDSFIRYKYPLLLDSSRAAAANLLNAPLDTIVFVPNATMAVNTVLRNLQWNADGKDEILSFTTIYGACGATIDYMVESNRGLVSSREIVLTYPCEDDEILSLFCAAVETSRKEGKRPKICLFDTITSIPGVRFPFEAMTKLCRDFGILSLIDGAHGVGQIELDLSTLDPDFFLSNCHKWLYVPRGCAAFYVPPRNQGLIRSTVPTSHGYVSKMPKRANPLPVGRKSAFVKNFEWMGTIDNSPYICVKDAIDWREQVLGEERGIREYMQNLAREGGKRVAEILGTEVMENRKGTLTQCAMVNVALPFRINTSASKTDSTASPKGERLGTSNARNSGEISISESIKIELSLRGGAEADEYWLPEEEVLGVTEWMQETLIRDYKTFVVVYPHGHRLWTRLSAQVYLDLEDFEWAGHTLHELCQRVAKGEYLD
ncbi:pyridoxal phosphate-dependent transferase [Pseudomassariella vexata]|uniref:Pyridoxal phosphate-dependent transferase n=1 Tax=Pseudomassariella vexata TaxID=1141098 RepID=A0A1Y2DK86_9PEZI|nr:pyridoxal phosphate-dependent transferase [Pseudomassariella vexata]ORY59643.1 pyridoxal phosphate-dependent transferase [Pseudomassariella vexata]